MANIYQFQFAVNNEVWMEFSIPHDYVPGTEIFLQANYSVIVVVAENVTWGFDCTYAKEHTGGNFPATTNTQIASATVGGAFCHISAFVQISGGALITTADLEIGGVILVRVYLAANSGATAPFLHSVSLMYQTTGLIGTFKKTNGYYS